jgi:hypothetical protein
MVGGWGPEFDAIVAPILPCLGPVGGLGVDHDGVTTAEKECRRVEGRKGRVGEVHRGFFKEAHLNGGPLISGAACAGEEGDVPRRTRSSGRGRGGKQSHRQGRRIGVYPTR